VFPVPGSAFAFAWFPACLPAGRFRLLLCLRHRHGAFLSTSLPSLPQCTAAIVRQRPALSAGGKSACGQENPQNSGMSVLASIWYNSIRETLYAIMKSPSRRIPEEFPKKADANVSPARLGRRRTRGLL
jgi:hypothetical protein